MLAWGDDRVLRPLKDPALAVRLEREQVALAAAGSAGVPVPAVFGRETVDGRPGLVMERLDGPDPLTLLDRRPWLLPKVARILGQTHAAVHAPTVPSQLLSVLDYVQRQLADSNLVPDDMCGPALEHLPDGDRICHWDFQPANVRPR
jgi:aminoglycoside phosphotransferase (APT) family kinase protein